MAVPVKDLEIVEKIKKIQKNISLSNADIKFVEPENFHYNLKFFGEKTEEEIQKIVSVTEKTLVHKKIFELEISGLGVFPSLNSARVAWLGLKKGEKEMLSLFENLEKAFAEIGIEKEKRSFQPHLTLGRMRSVKNLENLKEKVKEEQNVFIGNIIVDNIVLFQSKLSRNGPAYMPVKVFKLG